jgi:predicted transcriptional regulator of viral defense system
MPGRAYSALLEVATDHYGFVTPEDARALGIDPQRLVVMADRAVIERADRGIYRFPTVPHTPLDQLMQATLWPRRQGVLSHSTALDLHDLCDVNPAKIDITLPRSLRIRRKLPPPYVLHRRDLQSEDETLHEGIPVVSPFRAILDGIEAHLRTGLIEQAIDTARRRGLLRKDQLATIGKRLHTARDASMARA